MNNPALRKTLLFIVYTAILLIIIGMLVDKFKGVNEYAYLNTAPPSAWQSTKSDLQILPANFKIEYYPPDYALYKPVCTSSTSNAGQTITESVDYEFITQVRPHRDGSINAGKYGSLPPGALLINNTQWISQAVLPNGFLLQSLHRSEKNYILLLSASSSGKSETFAINVNQPAKFQNRLLHLVSFDKTAGIVILKIRHAPGRLLARTGFFLLIVCSVLLSIAGKNYVNAR